MKTSLHVVDQLAFNESTNELPNGFKFSNGELTLDNGFSGKLIGEVNINEYDAYGRKVFSDKVYNDITLPGSIFMLEQMFKIQSNEQNNTGSRFLHPRDKMPITIDSEQYATSNEPITTINIPSQKIFGFMVGRGGEQNGNVIVPDYRLSSLTSFMPFRQVEKDSDKYNSLKGNYAFECDLDNTAYFYVKKIGTPEIHVKWADGSGDVNSGEVGKTNTPIVTYAQCELNIDAEDVRDYFGDMNLDSCSINQLGLVAGQPVLDTDGNETGEYGDIKLFSCVNFKSRDLSNTENTLKITYKIYCL